MKLFFFFLKKQEKKTKQKNPQTNKKKIKKKKEKKNRRPDLLTSSAVIAKILVEAAELCSSWECLGFVSPKEPQTWLQGHGGDPRGVAEKAVPPVLGA